MAAVQIPIAFSHLVRNIEFLVPGFSKQSFAVISQRLQICLNLPTTQIFAKPFYHLISTFVGIFIHL